MTMDGIKEWLRADKERGNKMMWENKSYVFFRLLDAKEGEDGPIGAQGVSLTPGRSLAVDPSFHALGLPVFVAAPELKDETRAPFRRLMIAQDVGSAIKGVERGDIYWGSGDDAGAIAGKTSRRRSSSCFAERGAGGVRSWASAGKATMTTKRCGRRSQAPRRR